MANIKSAIKRNRQNIMMRAINRTHRSKMRTAIKKFRNLLAEGDVDEARSLLDSTYSTIDKTSKQGLIHRNQAARIKSRLAASLRRATS